MRQPSKIILIEKKNYNVIDGYDTQRLNRSDVDEYIEIILSEELSSKCLEEIIQRVILVMKSYLSSEILQSCKNDHYYELISLYDFDKKEIYINGYIRNRRHIHNDLMKEFPNDEILFRFINTSKDLTKITGYFITINDDNDKFKTY